MEVELGPRERKRRSSNNRKESSVRRDAGLGEEKKGFAGQMQRSTSQVNAQCWHRSRGAVPMMRRERGSEGAREGRTPHLPQEEAAAGGGLLNPAERKKPHMPRTRTSHGVPTHLPQKTWQTHATVRVLLSPMPCLPSVSETKPRCSPAPTLLRSRLTNNSQHAIIPILPK
jgi:hypothetical protein